MSEIFVPTCYYKNYDNGMDGISNVVVGLFDNEEDAIKALFKKLIEEDCFSYYYSYITNENDKHTIDETLDIIYNKFNECKDENKSGNQNLIEFIKGRNQIVPIYGFMEECHKIYVRYNFGRGWGCKIDSLPLLNGKPVMK